MKQDTEDGPDGDATVREEVARVRARVVAGTRTVTRVRARTVNRLGPEL